MNGRKIVVLGGGTAGWITVHMVRRLFPDEDITIVYSEKKGIVGVGEATTPSMPEFLREIGVDLLHFLKKTGGSIKHGISFENWNGDGKKYLHPYIEEINNISIPGVFSHGCWDWYNKFLIKNNLSFDDYLYQNKLAYKNKIDIDNTKFAVHFNTYEFGEYLKEFSYDKNIKIINDEYVSSELGSDGNIKKLILETQTIDCDFVFDCSGFAKLIIGGVYNEEWISYKKHLPMKKAVSFWLDAESEIPPYTAAVAMKYGWMWKIPLRDRYGCGYVYDSDYIDEHQAQKEAEEYFGKKIDVKKVIDIDAGRYKNVWVKNCMAVGLSGNFIEPLESTSIWLELALLSNLKHFAHELFDPSELSVKIFNEIIGNEVDEKMNFVYLHYMSKRNDSDFWLEFKQKNQMPDGLKKIWPYLEECSLRFQQINNSMCPSKFPLMSYLWVGAGLELIDRSKMKDVYRHIEPDPEMYRLIADALVENAADHRKFLEYLKDEYR